MSLVLALIETKTMHRAAESLNLSQPAATKLLQEIERTLGVTLFERQPRGMVPTAYGLAAARHARLLLRDLHRLQQEMEGLKRGIEGTVHLGAVMASVPHLISEALAAVTEQHPTLRVTLLTDTSDALLAELHSGRLDVVIGRPISKRDRDSLTWEPLIDEQLTLVVGTNHPLLARVSPTALVYFCYGWTGWLYFTWLPGFFLHAYSYDIKRSAIFSSGVFFAGVVGDGLGGVVADRIFKRTRSLMLSRSVLISLTFVASALCLIPVLASSNLTVMTLSLSAALFFIEMSIAPTWLVPMDIAPAYTGTASGIINAGSAVAGVISPILFGLIIDKTGRWTTPFIGSIVLLLIGAVLALRIRPEIRMDAEGSLAKTGMEQMHPAE